MRVFIPITQPASLDSIAKLKKMYGLNLPDSYLLFLEKHDGAEPEDNIFQIGEGNSAGVDQFIPAREIINTHKIVEGFPKNALPIARATAGNFVYLNPKNDAIYFWDHENDFADIKLADSFDEFLVTLKKFDANQIKLKPGQVKKIWVNPNFEPEF